MTEGSVLALVAFGYNLVFASTRVVNFAQGSMVVVSGYLAFALVREGIPIWPALALTVLGSLVIGVIVDLVALRPLGRFDPAVDVGWVLTTFAVGLIAIDVTRGAIGSAPHRLPSLVRSIAGWRVAHLSGVPVTPEHLVVLVATVALVVGLELLQHRTGLGRAFRAVAQDHEAASLMGIDPRAVVLATFALAGALAAVAAVVVAPLQFVALDNSVSLGVQAFVAALLGGLGSTRGAVAGGYAVGLVTAVVTTVSSNGSNYVLLVVFGLLLVVLVTRPTGLFGERAVVRA